METTEKNINEQAEPLVEQAIDNQVAGDDNQQIDSEGARLESDASVAPNVVDEDYKIFIEKKNEFEEFLKSKKEAEELKDQPYDKSKEFSDVLKFASENKLATIEDFLQAEKFEKLTEQDKLSIAKDKFAKDFVYSFEDLTEEEKEEELDSAFKEEFLIGSKSAMTLIDKLIEDEFKDVNEKVSNVKESYISNALAQKTVGIHEETFNHIKDDKLKTHLTVNGEAIEIEIDAPIEKAEYFKIVKENEDLSKGFMALTQTDAEKAKLLMSAHIIETKKAKYQDKINEAIYNEAFSRASKGLQDSRIGATAQFGAENNSERSLSKDEENKRKVQEILNKTY